MQPPLMQPPLMQLQLIDTHCHIDFADFDHDRDQVIQAASNAQVNDIIVPAITHESWPRTIQICSKYSSCHLALGLHPIFINAHQPQHLTALDSFAEQYSPIAIGEIGLDFYSPELQLNREKQTLFFTKQLIIAKQHDLPVIIHNRKAHDECIQLLREHQLKGGIIHAFNGNIQQAHKYIEMGFLLGFGGMLTYQRSNKLRTLLKSLPLNAIVLETDAPDMTVQQHRGERNSPEYIPYILEAVSDINGMEQSEIAKITRTNVQQLFSI